MINRRAYIAESAIKPGCAVVQGSADNKVKAPTSSGGGDFIGVYPFEANEEKKDGEEIGIVLHGVAKVLAGTAVQAGKPAGMKNDGSGAFVSIGGGSVTTVGLFLESGSAGEYVDALIGRGFMIV